MTSAVAETQSGAVWSPQRPWRAAGLSLALMVSWVVFLYRDALLGMVEIWSRSDTFAHCFLILPISLWLVWRKRSELAMLVPRPAPLAAVPMAVAGAAWLVGELATVNALTHFSFVSVLVLSVIAVVGTRVAARIAFPLAFLYFSVPFGEFVMPQMMEWTADFTVTALRLTGIPVYREGLQFVIPSGNWSVVEACSGVRYLIASVTVGTLFAYLSYQSIGKRSAFVAVSILVPIVANWLRAYMIVILGHLSGNRLAVGVDHLIYGWVFFGVVIMIMFVIGGHWSDAAGEGESATTKSAVVPENPAWPARGGLVVLLFGFLAALPHGAYAIIESSEPTGATAVSLPDQVGQWRLDRNPPIDWRPAFDSPSSESHVSYRDGDRSTGVFVAYYRNQRAGRTLVSSINMLVRSSDERWTMVKTESARAPFGPKDVPVQVSEFRGHARLGDSAIPRWTALQSFWIAGTWTTRPSHAKLLTAMARIGGRGDDSAVVVVYAPREQGIASLEEFTKVAGAEIEAALNRAREGR